jgi:hypothetical protein
MADSILGASGASSPDRASQHAAASVREAQVGDASWGDLSNTPPSITKCLGGEDWLELGLYLQHTNFDQVKKWLDAARDAAESNQRGPDELEIAGRKFLMLAGSATAGTKEKHVAYRWRLRSEDGWTLLLMNRADVHKTLPTGIARASSLPLLRIGPKAFLEQLRETLDDLGIDFQRDKLSRVDPCVDLTDVSIEPLYHAFMRGHYVTRARYSTEYIVDESIEGYRMGRRPSGFDLGKGDVRLRVYDKLLKCMSDFEMLLLMQTRRWGDIATNAIRVEFEIRREKLKALGVDSINDWWDKRGSITQYLTHDWCRVTDGEVDSRHADRALFHPDWVKVQEAFPVWAGEPLGDLSPLSRLPIQQTNCCNKSPGRLCHITRESGPTLTATRHSSRSRFAICSTY